MSGYFGISCYLFLLLSVPVLGQENQSNVERDFTAIRDSLVALNLKLNKINAHKRDSLYKNTNRPDTLLTLDFSYFSGKKLPDYTYRFKNTKKILMEQSSIVRLPRKLKKLDSLESINITNPATEKGLQIARLKQLEVLSTTKIKQADQLKFQRLVNIKKLTIMDSDLTEYPFKKITQLRQLKELNLSGNPLKISHSSKATTQWIEILKLNRCALDSIPGWLFTLPNIKEIQLQENNLTTIPSDEAISENLTKLSFYKNKLSSVPESIFRLKNLEALDLYYNKIRRLPGNIGEAKKLAILFISNNELIELPESIGQLQNLEELYAHHNRLSSLPISIEKLKKLKVIRLNENLFSEFPLGLLSLENLIELDVDHNLLTSFPAEISRLQSLKLFTFQYNPIEYSERNAGFFEAMHTFQEKGTIIKPSIRKETDEEDY